MRRITNLSQPGGAVLWTLRRGTCPRGVNGTTVATTKAATRMGTAIPPCDCHDGVIRGNPRAGVLLDRRAMSAPVKVTHAVVGGAPYVPALGGVDLVAAWGG